MKIELKRVVSGVVLAFFIGSLFFSLHHMAFGMTMDGSMSDCPYMAHETVLCPMNLFDHIAAWKAEFSVTVPSLFVLAGLLLAAATFVAIAPNLLRKLKFWLLRIPTERHRAQVENFIVRSLQELFSSGILHPKLF